MDQSTLWMLADLFEDRSKDKHHYGPLQRIIWKQAHADLKKALGERKPNGG